MFSRTKHSWCIVARIMTHYSKTSANQLSSEQQVGIQIVKPISYGIPLLQKSVPLRNPLIALENDEPDQQEDEQNYYSAMSKAFGFAGLMGILKGDSVGDEKKDLGEGQIVHMIKLARLSQERKEYKKSEQLLHLALKAAHEIQHYDAQRYIIDDMANNAYEVGDLKKAERLFINLMKQLIADGMAQDDNAIIHISAKLANLYAMFREEAKAREGFRFCIHHLETKLKMNVDDFDTSALYSLILSWFGDFVHSSGDFTQSLALFKQSYEISVKINGKHHPHSLLQLNNMAASYTMMNRLEDAVDCLNSALILAQEYRMDDGLKDLPYYFINLANVYLTQVEKSAADAKELLKLAESSCQEGFNCAKMMRNREAMLQAKKCMKQIKSHQTL